MHIRGVQSEYSTTTGVQKHQSIHISSQWAANGKTHCVILSHSPFPTKLCSCCFSFQQN